MFVYMSIYIRNLYIEIYGDEKCDKNSGIYVR